jgi:rubrerythrin
MKGVDEEKQLPFSCPVCGRKKDYFLHELFEGAVLTCPFCKLNLTLHGHMWKDVQKEIERQKTLNDHIPPNQ